MFETLRTARAVLRSLRVYYGHRERTTAMGDLYRQFVQASDLVFDVGAHVGDRVGAFRRLGAKVVAVEPQPALALTLGAIYGRDRSVVLERKAVGRTTGEITLKVNIDNPTVTTASDAFVKAADGAAGWEGQHWGKSIRVPMTTLDALIAAHGRPAFIKIDVEGFEEEVLAGLSQPVKALSFEFTTIQRSIAQACIERCAALGYVGFNAALGESQELGEWRSAAEISRWLETLPHAANSGDIYARLD